MDAVQAVNETYRLAQDARAEYDQLGGEGREIQWLLAQAAHQEALLAMAKDNKPQPVAAAETR